MPKRRNADELHFRNWQLKNAKAAMVKEREPRSTNFTALCCRNELGSGLRVELAEEAKLQMDEVTMKVQMDEVTNRLQVDPATIGRTWRSSFGRMQSRMEQSCDTLRECNLGRFHGGLELGEGPALCPLWPL
jgi:hypothetical protein